MRPPQFGDQKRPATPAFDPATVAQVAVDEIYIIDEQTGRFVYANDLAVANTGYSLEEFQTMTPLDLQKGTTIETLAMRIQPLRNGTDSAATFEATYYRKDRTAYTVEHRIQLLRSHVPPVYVVRARPISEVDQPLPALPPHDVSLYRQFVDEADVGIWAIDADQKTTYANEAMAGMLGYTLAEMISTPIWRFTDDNGRAIGEANLERRRRGERQRMEFKYIHKDGHEVWALVVAHPLMDAEGTYKGAYAIVRDITEQRLQDRALLDAIHVKEPSEIWRQPPVAGQRPQVRMPGVLGLRAARVAKRFSILSDPRRLELIELLASDEERTVTALGKELHMTQSNVSKHLKVLSDAGLVSRRQEGAKTIYALTDPTVAILCRIVYHWLGNQAETELQAFAS